MTPDMPLALAPAPLLIQAGDTTLLAVAGEDAARAIATAGTSHAVLAFADAAQLRQALSVIPTGLDAIFLLTTSEEDPRTHRASWDAAAAEAAPLKALAPAVTVVPAPPLGWARYLEVRGGAGEVEAQLQRAVKLPTRAPARGQGTGPGHDATFVPEVDEDRGLLVMPPAPGLPPQAIMTAAPVVERVVHIVDGIHGEVDARRTLVDLRVLVGPTHDRETVRIPGIDLRDVHQMNWVGAGALASVTWARDARTTGLIENAIRAQIATAPAHRVLNRTGWVQHEGRAAWLHAGGYVDRTGSHRVETDPEVMTAAHLDGAAARLDLPEVPDPAEALRHAHTMWLNVQDPALRGLLLGLTRASLAGLGHAGDGTGLGVVGWLAGPRGGGKTHTLACLNSGLAEVWRTIPMGKIDGSAASKRELGIELEDCWQTIDDYRPRKSPRAKEAQEEIFDDVTRRGFERGAARTVKVQDARGAWRLPDPVQTSPAVLFAGEQVPEATDQASTVDRLVIVEYRKERIQWEALGQAASSPLWREATTAFLAHVARRIDADGWEAWCRTEGEAIAKLAASMDRFGSHRASRGLAVITRGYRLWLNAMVEAGVVTADEAAAEVAEVQAALVAETRTQRARTAEADTSMIGRIRELVAAGRLAAVGWPLSDADHGEASCEVVVTSVGKPSAPAEHIFLAHGIAARALGVTPAAVLDGLREHIIPVPTSDGGSRLTDSRKWSAISRGRRVTTGGTSVVRIPLAAWVGDVEAAEDDIVEFGTPMSVEALKGAA
ncbi:hypothetical protein [Microbacterium sp. NPDC055683]